MLNQAHEIRVKKIFIALCKTFPRLCHFKFIQNLVLGQYFEIVDNKDYYSKVCALISLSPKQGFDYYKKEILDNIPLRQAYEKAINDKKIPQKHKRYELRFNNSANVVNYYALIRETKPDIVVETGTATGSMTAWVLSALEANGKGELISIDIPPKAGELTMAISIGTDDIGFLIPHEYRHRWKYIVGDAKVQLPKVMAENKVDIFIHDSLHTRTHMLFEYNVARCLIKPQGIIMSDDILLNGSFFQFLKSHKLKGLGCISNPNLGLTVNTYDEYETTIGTGIIDTSGNRT
jgi:predicted O-methyltransferase YrrM